MQIKFQESNSEIVESLKNISLEKIFGMITYGPKDDDTKKAMDRAISLVDVYVQNYANYHGKFPPVARAIEYSPLPKKKLIKNVKVTK